MSFQSWVELNKIKNENEINVCNNESIWNKTWTFLGIIDLQNGRNKFYSKFQRYSYLCSWAPKIPPSKMSRYLGTCVLIKNHKTYFYLCQQYLMYCFSSKDVWRSSFYWKCIHIKHLPYSNIDDSRSVTTGENRLRIWYGPLESNAIFWVLK